MLGSRLRRYVLDGILVVGAIAGVSVAARATCAHEDALLGLRLGMTAREAREAFAPGAAGRFRVSGDGAHVIAWEADGRRSGAPVAAALELHDGRLVNAAIEFSRGPHAPSRIVRLQAPCSEPAP